MTREAIRMGKGKGNLIPGSHKLTRDDQVSGGKKSGETRRRRKAFAEAFNVLLGREFNDTNGNTIQGVEAIAAKVFQSAMNGDLKAVQIIRDTVGEAPVQRIESVEISEEAYEAVRAALEED